MGDGFPTDGAQEKAVSLYEQRRILPLPPRTPDITGALVLGDHDSYAVYAHREGFQCDCRAGANHSWHEPRCTHVLAAMLYWADGATPEPRLLEALQGRSDSSEEKHEATPDPKPEARIINPDAGLTKLRLEGECRLCRTSGMYVALTRHHLVKRSQGGDDVDENIIPLCGHGTRGCHGDIEAYRGDARARLRARLLPEELRYITTKKSAAWLEQHYPATRRNAVT